MSVSVVGTAAEGVGAKLVKLSTSPSPSNSSSISLDRCVSTSSGAIINDAGVTGVGGAKDGIRVCKGEYDAGDSGCGCGSSELDLDLPVDLVDTENMELPAPLPVELDLSLR